MIKMFQEGSQIYKYTLNRKVGGGYFGEVWTAKDNALDIDIAIKLLPNPGVSVDKRLFEAKIGCRLHHDNVVNIRNADIITYNGRPLVIIAMPYFENGAITGHLNSGNFLPLKRGIQCIRDILRGLEYLHANGFYHCDVKPNNILCGDNGECLLADYGITCVSPDHGAVYPHDIYLTHETPETLQYQQYDNRSDIYQVGLTMFRLLNGVFRIHDSVMADSATHKAKVMAGKIIKDNDYLPHIPNNIRKVISKATALLPENRYQNAIEMRRDLEKIFLSRDCTTDEQGRLIIFDDRYVFRFELIPNGKFVDIIYFKKNLSSMREVKISEFSVYKVPERNVNKELKKIQTALILKK